MTSPVPLILVVEDNPVNSTLTAKVINHLNYDAAVAEDGEQALAWCNEHVAQLVIMDISLPGMDGLDVTRKLRQLPTYAEVPIIALTAHAMGDWEQRTRDAGCTAYLAKPVRPRDLMDAIEQYLAQ